MKLTERRRDLETEGIYVQIPLHFSVPLSFRLYRGATHTISPLITVITRHVFIISISGIFIMSAETAVRSATLPQVQHQPAIRMYALNISKEALTCGFRQAGGCRSSCDILSVRRQKV